MLYVYHVLSEYNELLIYISCILIWYCTPYFLTDIFDHKQRQKLSVYQFPYFCYFRSLIKNYKNLSSKRKEKSVISNKLIEYEILKAGTTFLATKRNYRRIIMIIFNKSRSLPEKATNEMEARNVKPWVSEISWSVYGRFSIYTAIK